MRKIALLTGAAGLLLIAGPALAQEATPPGRNPVPEQTAPAQTPPTATPPAAQTQAPIALNPGATVRGPDGELGKLESVRVNAQGQQELTVRGTDGQVRSVPLGGLQVNGGEVSVAWSLEQYQASPAIAAEPAPATPPAGETAPPVPAAPVPTLPTDPQPSDPAAPTTTTDPMNPGNAAPPPTEDPQA
ncbi:MAG: hypothetical protein V4707_09255 [Pseudomonadota bacterium]